ncbi:hypothetical protein V8F06_008015 [Rhypophila decipiens]
MAQQMMRLHPSNVNDLIPMFYSSGTLPDVDGSEIWHSLIWKLFLPILPTARLQSLKDDRGRRPLDEVTWRLSRHLWVSQRTLGIFLDTVVALRNAGSRRLKQKATISDNIRAVRDNVIKYRIVGYIVDERDADKHESVLGLFKSPERDWRKATRKNRWDLTPDKGLVELRADDGRIISGHIYLMDKQEQLKDNQEQLKDDQEQFEDDQEQVSELVNSEWYGRSLAMMRTTSFFKRSHFQS